jgi:hypothetical protein
MSYLDFPRIHFTGGFQAAPSTVNNAPSNYERARLPQTQPWDLDTWWNAYGNAFFNLEGCTVSAVQSGVGQSGDTIVGQQVFAAYTSSPPKIVDLDPVQQNVSEWWGFTLQVGTGGATGSLTGSFAPIAFNNIWVEAAASFGGASGAGVYQSSLTDVVINPGNSAVLATLQKSLGTTNRLSARIHLRAYNASDVVYDLTPDNLATLRKGKLSGLPTDVWTNLQTISKYQQGAPANTPRGQIVATQFLNHLMQRWLGERAAGAWGAIIRTATAMPYTSPVSTPFTHGKLVGTIGPSLPGEPKHWCGKRMLAPVPPLPPAANATANFAQFQVENGVLSVDLLNALRTQDPVDGPFQNQGTLSIGYCASDLLGNGNIPLDYPTFLATGGIFDLQLSSADAAKAKSTALGVYSTPPLPAPPTPPPAPTALIVENPAGWWMRADQFVFRMNPGAVTTDASGPVDMAQLQVGVRQFGAAPPDGTVTVALTLMGPHESYKYTNSTIGTGGTPGLKDVKIGVPAEKLTFAATATVQEGVATFTLTAQPPGNPRKFIDGQIYFLQYAFDPPVASYQQGPDDLVSVLVFDDVDQDKPTWENSIGAILGQYGRLYPIMWRFGLDSHDSVKQNAEQIRVVLERSMDDPFHMPVTRDLSKSRRALILKWMKSGMP